ncbi:phosphatase PAP2/dual specificity phosphatase family protein [Rhodopirellula sp. MGV]|uniref:phosphatase PAP2/dual specificity phosphatase family protein n=1 Tax=Rhodopirellula sp. MGV TaxID=2023130 RepID=UPI00117B63C6|nr:phosphatase PAP2/dual specificity phosphatase family protein [Rhodopirellula sp. MGV]
MSQTPQFAESTVNSANRQCPSWTEAGAVALVTSALFLVFYGGAAYLTSFRQDVGTWYYEWEQIIPFVPIMIVPYMSIDAFFIAAPFFCSSRSELRVLGKRLSAIVFVAAACFLIYPLELAVQRPQPTGLFGDIYTWFTAMDRPFNLCPSMHIALRTVLAVHYGKHCRGLTRIAMNIWFFLIGCSTLLLYQHHFIDVLGGFILATFVMYVFDGLGWRRNHTPSFGIAGIYAFSAMLFIVPITIYPKLGWFTLWPGVACAITSLGYLCLGESIYRRCGGRLSWPTRFVLGPVLAGQWLSWKYYATQSNVADHVLDNVWIGRLPNQSEATQLVNRAISAVIDVCVAFDETPQLRTIERLELPILDLTAPTTEQLIEAAQFIESNRERGVLVHCKAGYSRSAALIAGWLVMTGRCGSTEDAFELIRRARPKIVVRPEIRNLRFESNTLDFATHLHEHTLRQEQPCLASTI